MSGWGGYGYVSVLEMISDQGFQVALAFSYVLLLRIAGCGFHLTHLFRINPFTLDKWLDILSTYSSAEDIVSFVRSCALIPDRHWFASKSGEQGTFSRC